MTALRVAIIGAGIGGLAAAIDLAAAGCAVVLLERQATPGGKMRTIRTGSADIDAGPTVFTMRWVFESLFERARTSLAAHLTLRRANILARHAWRQGETLDLYADIDRTAEAIGIFAGKAEAEGFRAFSRRARQIYDTLETPFLLSPRPSPFSLVRDAGVRAALALAPFDTMMSALAAHFADARLRQLFGRYATYCGSSPYLSPATLMLVAHVERDGVWLVEGGMQRLARAMATVAGQLGVDIRYDTEVEQVCVDRGRASAVRIQSGERIAADAIIVNADAASLATGCLGPDVVRAIPPVAPAQRSLSALTWSMQAETSGFDLTRHNVFFSGDYQAEFTDIFERRRLPRTPTVYVCAQDRVDDEAFAGGPERLLCLVNAPPDGDKSALSAEEIEQCQASTSQLLQGCGLDIQPASPPTVTTPRDFAHLFPATGGALYGQAVHGPMATFRRPGTTTKIPGLYLAGGSTHPGAGVPMAALSGRLAAMTVLAHGASTSQSRPVATNGGTSTRSAMTGSTASP